MLRAEVGEEESRPEVGGRPEVGVEVSEGTLLLYLIPEREVFQVIRGRKHILVSKGTLDFRSLLSEE